jgi:hypothetical protein
MTKTINQRIGEEYGLEDQNIEFWDEAIIFHAIQTGKVDLDQFRSWVLVQNQLTWDDAMDGIKRPR